MFFQQKGEEMAPTAHMTPMDDALQADPLLPARSTLTNLQALEAESLYILREAAA